MRTGARGLGKGYILLHLTVLTRGAQDCIFCVTRLTDRVGEYNH